MKEEIKANLELLNKVGKLLRRDGEYGNIIASKEHIYINDIYNVTGNMWISKKIGETPVNVHDIVLYALV